MGCSVATDAAIGGVGWSERSSSWPRQAMRRPSRPSRARAATGCWRSPSGSFVTWVWPKTPFSRRSSSPGASSVGYGMPINSMPGSIDFWSTSATQRRVGRESGRAPFACCRPRGRADRTTSSPSHIAISWSARSVVSRPEQRAVFVFHHYLGLTLAEVAGQLGIPLGTVKSRLHYATVGLRAALEADARTEPARTERPA